MPAQGIVTVEVSPFNARMIAWWLRTYHQPTRYEGILGEYLWQYRDHHDVDAVAKKFEKLIARKRPGGPFASVAVQISREDALWLAKRVRRPGMFGNMPRPKLPDAVALLCYRCAEATTKKRGRKTLARDRLQAALEREHLDERHRKRLRRRHREEVKLRESAGSFQGILGKALMDAAKST